MFIRYYTRHPRKKEELGKSNQIFAKIAEHGNAVNFNDWGHGALCCSDSAHSRNRGQVCFNWNDPWKLQSPPEFQTSVCRSWRWTWHELLYRSDKICQLLCDYDLRRWCWRSVWGLTKDGADMPKHFLRAPKSRLLRFQSKNNFGAFECRFLKVVLRLPHSSKGKHRKTDFWITKTQCFQGFELSRHP